MLRLGTSTLFRTDFLSFGWIEFPDPLSRVLSNMVIIRGLIEGVLMTRQRLIMSGGDVLVVMVGIYPLPLLLPLLPSPTPPSLGLASCCVVV